MATSEALHRADFFVHPDFHRLSGGEVTEEIKSYEAALHQRIDNSPLPVLLYVPNPTVQRMGFWHRFPPEQRFPTRESSGILPCDDESRRRFNRLMEEREVLEGIVHGSYLEQCVKAFKTSLRANSSNGVLYYRHIFWLRDLGNIRKPETVAYGLVLKDTTRGGGIFSSICNQASNASPQYAEDAYVYHTSPRSSDSISL